MPNMPHCRFQNTLRDLEEIFEHYYVRQPEKSLSPAENSARLELLSLMKTILVDEGYLDH